MAGAMSDYLEAALLDHVLRGVVYAPPAALYLALFTVPPGETGGGTEVSGGGYARQAVSFTPPSNSVCSNDADIVFPIATSDWGSIAGFGLFDAATGGNMLLYGTFAIQKQVLSGDQFVIRAGNLSVTMD